jgi:hypothetical protein
VCFEHSNRAVLVPILSQFSPNMLEVSFCRLAKAPLHLIGFGVPSQGYSEGYGDSPQCHESQLPET